MSEERLYKHNVDCLIDANYGIFVMLNSIVERLDKIEIEIKYIKETIEEEL